MFCSLFPEYVEIWKEREAERKKREAEGGQVLEKRIVNSEGNVWGEGAVVWQFVAGVVVALMSILFAIRFI